MSTATAIAERVVYTRSLWHRDCDPFLTIVALDAETANRQMDACADDEWSRNVEDFACPECCEFGEPVSIDDGLFVCDVHGEHQIEDTIMTGGLFSESLDALELTREQRMELSEHGYVYIA